jgi:hypothetical protein
MRITEAGLRKIVREMLKEAAAGGGAAYDAAEAVWKAKAAGKVEKVKADNAKNIVANLRDPLTRAASPTAATPPAPQTPPPVARQPRGNPTVMQVQKIIRAQPDGFWGQQTQTNFINFVQNKINEGILLLSVDGGRQINANELSNWKNIASQIEYVGNSHAPQGGFEPNINGLVKFLTFLNIADPVTKNPNRAPAARPLTMEDELEKQYLDWSQPGSTTKAYFNQPK